MPNSTYDYDMLIIGSGPAGHRAAIQASKLGKRACVIEKQTVLGGVCINTGTIPSKSLREAALRLSGYREREIYGASYVKSDVTMGQLLFRVDQVIHNEIDVIRHQLQRNHIEFHNAMASFVDPHRVHVTYADGTVSHDITAEYIVIAVGTTPAKDAKVYTD